MQQECKRWYSLTEDGLTHQGWPFLLHILQSHEENGYNPTVWRFPKRRDASKWIWLWFSVSYQSFTNRWMQSFKNMSNIQWRFAIDDIKTGVITKSDLSVATAESGDTLVWPFCLSKKVNMKLKVRLKCQVVPRVSANITAGLWLDDMSFMSSEKCSCNWCLTHILVFISKMATPYLTRLVQNLVNWGWLRCISRESSWSAREVFSDVSSVFS